MKKYGFTLVEFVIGMTAGVSVALVAVFLWSPVSNWTMTQARRSGTSEAQAAAMRMIKEINRIKSPGDIQTFVVDSLSFIDIDNQNITFQKSGTDLVRNTDVLARNVNNLAFEYLDANGNVTAIKANIRVVRFTLGILSGGNTISLMSAARIRNTS